MCRHATVERWRGPAGIDWIEGDVMDRDAMIRAAKGTGTLVHAVSPPGYRDWEKIVLPNDR